MLCLNEIIKILIQIYNCFNVCYNCIFLNFQTLNPVWNEEFVFRVSFYIIYCKNKVNIKWVNKYTIHNNKG